MKRLFDIFAALVALLVLSPLLAFAAIGTRVSSPGPVIYKARRTGVNGKVFIIYKFRTMHTGLGKPWSPITAGIDDRVFPFGSLLRRLKIDELPQFVNVLKGEMSIVGPRPEDPEIVRKYYSLSQCETFRVLPGLASPGSIYNYTHGEKVLVSGDVEKDYVQSLLPLKLALEQVYVRRASFLYDMKIIFRTLYVIVATALGKKEFGLPPEMEALEFGALSSVRSEKYGKSQ